MSRKGGYKIIDLKGLDFSSNMVIDGIHESIEDNYGKPLLFSGIVIDGVEKDDVFVNAVVNGDGYDIKLYNGTLHISNIDVVSYSSDTIYHTFTQDNPGYTLLPNKKYIFNGGETQEDLSLDMEDCLGVFQSMGASIINTFTIAENNYLDLVINSSFRKTFIITTYNNIVMAFSNPSEF